MRLCASARKPVRPEAFKKREGNREHGHREGGQHRVCHEAAPLRPPPRPPRSWGEALIAATPPGDVNGARCGWVAFARRVPVRIAFVRGQGQAAASILPSSCNGGVLARPRQTASQLRCALTFLSGARCHAKPTQSSTLSSHFPSRRLPPTHLPHLPTFSLTCAQKRAPTQPLLLRIPRPYSSTRCTHTAAKRSVRLSAPTPPRPPPLSSPPSSVDPVTAPLRALSLSHHLCCLLFVFFVLPVCASPACRCACECACLQLPRLRFDP